MVDIPEPYKSKIQRIRDQLKTLTATLPVEITLTGSSGVGPIPEGADIELICGEVERVARSSCAFTMEFARISHFPNTGVFFIPPKDRRPFDALHASLAASKIPFANSPFPYTPHCTLRVGAEVEQSICDDTYTIAVPKGKLLIDTVSVYAIKGTNFAVSLLHKAKLPSD